MRRRTFLLGLAALPACVRPDSPGRALTRRGADAVREGGAFLLTQQTADGGFPSTTYGLLASGQSTTPFVVNTLLALPSARRPRGAWSTRALSFLSKQEGGVRPLGFASPAPDYPCYASGLLLSALARAGRPDEHRALAERTTSWLLTQQHRDPAWDGNPAQGGFSMGYVPPRQPPDAGHVDLSMTRRVLQGLAAWDSSPDALVAARPFIERCRTDDGGFVYSPVELGLNKAGCDGGCRSYGSATADGILALLATGLPATDPAVESARLRLVALHRLDENPGIPEGRLRGFARAMVGYYRAAAAQAFAATIGPPGWRAALVQAVVDEQRPDGSWANPEPLQKEDDPIIGTTIAVAALAAALWGEPAGPG